MVEAQRLESLEVTIVPRVTFDGRPFSEVRYVWMDGSVRRHALTRYWWVVSDNPHSRAAEREGFLRRRQQYGWPEG